MNIAKKRIEWNGGRQQEGIDILLRKGQMIVSPTKIGYIIMTSDFGGLKRKFSAKQRALKMEQLRELAEMNGVCICPSKRHS